MKKQFDKCFQNSYTAPESRLTRYFFSETIFILSHLVLADTEIEVLEKGLDFAPI